MQGPFTGKTGTKDADESGGRGIKFTPGDYYVLTSKGVYKPSQRVSGAIYFGVETRVVKVISAFTKEENAPYGATRPQGASASWTFNIKQQDHLMYLPLGNMRNLANALMNTWLFPSKLTQQEIEDLVAVNALATEGGELPAELKTRTGLVAADPYDMVNNLLVGGGGERLTGLPLRIEARDGRDPQKANANLFCACRCFAVTREEFEANYSEAVASAA